MNAQENIVELVGQTLAPRLYKLFGVAPEDMGFPIYETESGVAEHLDRQFSPVEHWTEQGRKIGQSVLNILEAGGVDVSQADLDAMLKAALKERPDVPPNLTDPA